MLNLYQRRDLIKLREQGLLPGSLPWIGADQAELWAWNLQRNPQIRDQYPNIQYQLNSQGFRCAEFAACPWADAVAVIGCSVVFGEGLAEVDTLCSQLSGLLDRPVINLGISGSSVDMIRANHLCVWSAGIRPWRVVTVWPTADRVTAYTAEGVLCMGSWSVSDHAQEQQIRLRRQQNPRLYGSGEELDRWSSVYQQINLDPVHQNTQLELASHTVRALWGASGLELTWAPSTAEVLGCDLLTWDRGDLARDQRHPGAETHRQWARQIADRLVSQP